MKPKIKIIGSVVSDGNKYSYKLRCKPPNALIPDFFPDEVFMSAEEAEDAMFKDLRESGLTFAFLGFDVEGIENTPRGHVH